MDKKTNNIRKILVAEDESIVALNIKKTLEKLGYEVTSLVSSGEEVIVRADNEHPDLILMDIMLKGSLDGIQAAGTIAKKNRIPIVFLTALSDEKTIDRAAYVKPYGYLVKPFTTREMHTAIENALINFEASYGGN